MKGFKSAIKWIVAIVVICVLFSFLASINGLNVTRTIITVDGNEITEGEYKFYVEMEKTELLNARGITDEAAAKEFLETGKVGEKAVADYIKEEALNQVVKYEYAIVKAKAAGITLTDEEREAVRNIDDAKEQIAELGVSERTYADILEKSYIVGKYYNQLVSTNPELFVVEDAEIEKKINEEYALVQHVLILNAPQDGTEADESYKAEANKKAKEVLKKAVDGANFEKLIADYNEDPGMESSPEGYLITKEGYTADGQGQMVPEFTNGAFAVKPNKVNPELVESSYGWHIIKRCEITKSNANYELVEQNAKNNADAAKFETYLDSILPNAEVVKKDKIIDKIKVEY